MENPHWLYALKFPKYRICKFGISDRADLFERIKELEKSWGRIPLSESYFVCLRDGQNCLLESSIHNFTKDFIVKDIPQKDGWTEMRDAFCWTNTINAINGVLKPYKKKLEIIGELIRPEYRFQKTEEEKIEEKIEEVIEETVESEEVIEETVESEEVIEETVESIYKKKYRVKNTDSMDREFDSIILTEYDLWDVSNQKIIIQKGSKISRSTVPSLEKYRMEKERNHMISQKIVDENFIVQIDHEVSSRSRALSAIMGSPTSPTAGRRCISDIQ